MKVTCLHGLILEALNRCKPFKAVQRSGSWRSWRRMECLENVRIEVKSYNIIRLHVNNLSSHIIHDVGAKVEEEGDFLINFEQFYNTVRTSNPNSQIILTLTDTHLEVFDGEVKTQIKLPEETIDDFPLSTTVECIHDRGDHHREKYLQDFKPLGNITNKELQNIFSFVEPAAKRSKNTYQEIAKIQHLNNLRLEFEDSQLLDDNQLFSVSAGDTFRIHSWERERYTDRPNTYELYIPQDDVIRLLKIKAVKTDKISEDVSNVYQVGHYSHPYSKNYTSNNTNGFLIFKSSSFTIGIHTTNAVFNLMNSIMTIYSLSATKAHFVIERSKLLKAIKRFRPLKPQAGDTYLEWIDGKVLFKCTSKEGMISTVELDAREQLDDSAKFGFNLNYLAQIAKMDNDFLTVDLMDHKENKMCLIKISEVSGPKEILISEAEIRSDRQ